MPEYMIADIPVQFPFEPYELQTAYMEKVIACLQNATNGVLESPTGTGKTLSLLCSSLAWIASRKGDLKIQVQKMGMSQNQMLSDEVLSALNSVTSKKTNWGIPKIIYASRTHSQLSQAMQELKRTAYAFMRAVVLGSRDQLCIHPDVMREIGNSNKIQMCKLRVDTKTCSFHSRVESRKDHPDFRGPTIMDIEDLVSVGQKLKMCPYFSSKELVNDADIIFMPYNYLLDPKMRKANKIELNNTVIILDEAHNIEKICEESASVQLRSSDVAMAIDDITHIMKTFEKEQDYSDEPKDFTIDQLALLKEMLLDFEKGIDDIIVENKIEGATYPASYMFEILARGNLTYGTVAEVSSLLERLIQFLAVQTQNQTLRKGSSLQTLSDLLSIVFFSKEDGMPKVYKSYKVHVQLEEIKQNKTASGVSKDSWLSKSVSTTTSKAGKILNYWCFNPGFGMEQLLNKNVRSIILTSGTLAPLKPLIAELSIPISQFLENPHIIKSSQIYVKIIGNGPDREQLISNYANRDNPKYINSLGQTILNVSRIVPDGLLVFFPSYPMLNQCVNSWQASGIWGNVSNYKPIFVEPRNKESFTQTMEEFYQSIRSSKGACFLAVCRGKVSEGLDFADRNGRAVIITGLPFPPLKDPKIILKKKYLEENRTRENELLSGQAWYGLDATRAVNQAIGRVIRHRNDYGAILLCDARFAQPSQSQQLSKWIRDHLGPKPQSSAFGPIVRELNNFFKTAEKTMPSPSERSVESLVQESCEEANIVRSPFFSDPKEISLKPKLKDFKKTSMKIENTNSIESWTPDDYAKAAGRSKNNMQIPSAMDFMGRLNSDISTIDFNNSGLVNIHKRDRNSSPPSSSLSIEGSVDGSKKKRYKLIDNNSQSLKPSCSQTSLFSTLNPSANQSQFFKNNEEKQAPLDRVEFLKVLRHSLDSTQFSAFTAALISYKNDNTFDKLISLLLELLGKPHLHYILLGMRRFLKAEHKSLFDEKVAFIT